ncbi:MAG: cobamide remodeling phosphodiesterase CbiR [Candidatus Thorarchaeota archaeon]
MPLRFGITALEIQEVASAVVVDGIPDFSRLDVANLIRNTASQGWSVLELSLDVKHIISNSITENTINNLIRLKEELGLDYTVHLPFWSIELATFNENVRQGSVESIVDSIELTKPLDPEYYVLHATGDLAANFSSLPYNPNLVRLISTLLAGFAATSVEEITSRTEINPRKLAIENVEFPFDIMRDVIDDLDTSICFDTAHLLCRFSGSESIMDFYNTHKNRISEIHLLDATYTEYDSAVARNDHITLGHGIMGDSVLREFLLELQKDKFDGPVIFELTKDEAAESLKLIKGVVPEVLN